LQQSQGSTCEGGVFDDRLESRVIHSVQRQDIDRPAALSEGWIAMPIAGSLERLAVEQSNLS
jgi:hypothetical protein